MNKGFSEPLEGTKGGTSALHKARKQGARACSYAAMVAKAEQEGWLQQHSFDDLAAFYGHAFDTVCAAALLHTSENGVHQARLSGEGFCT